LGVALPIVSADFGISVQKASWVVTIYQLTLTSLVLTSARLAEGWGFKRAYFIGYGLFFTGSLFSTFSFNLTSLVLARFIQALGASFLLAVNPALVASAFGPKERGKGLGMIGGTVGLGLILGPLVGGTLTGILGWRSIFWINLPISLFGILAAARILPWQEGLFNHGQKRRPRAVLGWANLFWIFAVYCFLSIMSTWPQLGAHFSSILLAVGFVVSLSLFLYFEKGERPLVGFELYRRAAFSLGILGLFLCYGALFSATFLVPFYLHLVLGEDPFTLGRVMSSIPLAVMLVAPLAGRLSDRLGNRWISVLGLLVSAGGIFSLIRLDLTSTPFQVVESLALVGIGTAMFQSPNSNSIMASVPEGRLATAAGVIATIRNLGMAFGVAFGAALFAFYQRKYAHFPVHDAFVYAFRNVFMVTGWLAILGMFTSLVRGRLLYDATGMTIQPSGFETKER